MSKMLSKSITSANQIVSDYSDYADKYCFTASELLGLLLQLRELRNFNISLIEVFNNCLQLNIDNSIYQIYFSSDDDCSERVCQ